MDNVEGSGVLPQRPPKAQEDPINPSYYSKHGVFAPVEIADHYDLNFDLGNVIKYVLRAGQKGDKLEDLKKAEWYLKHELGKHV